MFTSRAEHRLLLRIDNADLRLTSRGRDAGLIDNQRWSIFAERRGRFERNLAALDATLVRTAEGARVPATQLLRQPETRLETMVASGVVAIDIDPHRPAIDLASAETTIKYAGYLRRQEGEVERGRRNERRRIPKAFAFEQVPGLSNEAIQRLNQIRPDTLGHALRIPGITPAAVAVLSSYVSRFESAS
jgi:tRNA uridine 5-carboxymethylaminomethyl modification enzyme